MKNFRQRLTLWYEKNHTACFLAPAMITMAVFAVYVLAFLFYLALCNWNARSPSPTFTGLNNFIRMAGDREFWISLWRTVEYTAATVTGQVIVGFLLAYTLNRRVFGLGLIRTLLIVPMAMTPVVIGMFWKIIFDPSLGPINYYLSLLHIPGPVWIGASSTALASIMLVTVWQLAPYSFLTITAGFTSLPEEVYEAAVIDGANGFQILFRITIPMLKQVLLTLILLRMIEAFRAFDLIYTMTRGGPGTSTQLMPFYLYTAGFDWFDFGYAAALSVFLLFFVLFIFRLFINKTGVKVFYE